MGGKEGAAAPECGPLAPAPPALHTHLSEEAEEPGGWSSCPRGSAEGAVTKHHGVRARLPSALPALSSALARPRLAAQQATTYLKLDFLAR